MWNDTAIAVGRYNVDDDVSDVIVVVSVGKILLILIDFKWVWKFKTSYLESNYYSFESIGQSWEQ